MKFLLQNNLINKDHREQFKEALIKYKIPFTAVGMIPFTHEFLGDTKIEGVDWIPYGSTNMMDIALSKGYRGLSFTPETFDVGVWNDHRSDMLNQDCEIMSLEKAEGYLRTHFNIETAFVRPINDLKSFSGTVANGLEIADWFRDAMNTPDDSGTYHMSPDMLVVIARPKLIKIEWRWFIVGSTIVNGSMYKFDGRLNKRRVTDADTIRDAQAMADVWLPHDNCVMDVALTSEGLKVIEFNNINSSGFYDNDVEKIVLALWNYYT